MRLAVTHPFGQHVHPHDPGESLNYVLVRESKPGDKVCLSILTARFREVSLTLEQTRGPRHLHFGVHLRGELYLEKHL
jgi:hypothetical protein